MLNYSTFPPNLQDGIRRYIEDGTTPGSFLRAVIQNKLKESFEQADDENRFNMFNIVKWMYNEAPRACWGSPETVKLWIEARIEQKRKESEEKR